MSEIELYWFKCKNCGKSFPIEKQDIKAKKQYTAEEIEQIVKFCPYCGEKRIELKNREPWYYG